MATVAVYGGAFDPPHIGHAMVASWVYLTGLADTVLFSPAPSHPFGKNMAPYALRVAMCRALTTKLGSWASVSEAESQLEAPNYTINFLRHLQQENPQHQFRLVVGVDNLLQKDKWKGWDEIEADFSPIVVDRTGVAHTKALASPQFPECSSTFIRTLIQSGKPFKHLVPKDVHEIVVRESLYRS